MKFDKFAIGVRLLEPFSKSASISFVSNGAPANRSRYYIVVDIGDERVGPTRTEELRELGWVSEREGQIWAFMIEEK